jgi:hypothetical protein
MDRLSATHLFYIHTDLALISTNKLPMKFIAPLIITISILISACGISRIKYDANCKVIPMVYQKVYLDIQDFTDEELIQCEKLTEEHNINNRLGKNGIYTEVYCHLIKKSDFIKKYGKKRGTEHRDSLLRYNDIKLVLTIYRSDEFNRPDITVTKNWTKIESAAAKEFTFKVFDINYPDPLINVKKEVDQGSRDTAIDVFESALRYDMEDIFLRLRYPLEPIKKDTTFSHPDLK